MSIHNTVIGLKKMEIVGNKLNGWLAGLIDGDGHIKLERTDKGSPRWLRIVFANTDASICRQYIRTLEHFGVSYRICHANGRKRGEQSIYRINSGNSLEIAKLFSHIRLFSPHKHQALIDGAHWMKLDPIMTFSDLDMDYWYGYLGGLLDSEGHIFFRNEEGCHRYHIGFTNSDPVLLSQIRAILDMIGITYSEYVTEKEVNKDVIDIKVKRADDLLKIYERVPIFSVSKSFKLEMICQWINRPDKRRNWEELAPTIYKWLNEEKIEIDEVLTRLDMPLGRNRTPEIYRALRKYGFPVPDMRSSQGKQLKSKQDWDIQNHPDPKPIVKRPYTKHPPIDVEEAARLYYEEGLPLSEIVVKFGRTKGSTRLLSEAMKRAGYNITRQNYSKRQIPLNNA